MSGGKFSMPLNSVTLSVMSSWSAIDEAAKKAFLDPHRQHAIPLCRRGAD